MKRILTLSLLAAFFFGCSKDKFETVPQVEINSLEPGEVQNDGFFNLRATVRDKEGDLQDTIIMVRKRYVIGAANALTTDTLKYSIADFGFPDSQEIEIQANFSYAEDRPGFIFINLETIADREFAIGLIAKDKAGNRSEYRESNRIVLKKL
ncbi:MAG TPA: hypothetical protein VFR58_09680 [Flavisolibacter sp.]|nr:hypothetical protein [Flavisolibacter sp.]